MTVRIVVGYPALVGALLAVCAFSTPGWAAVAWCAIGLTSASAVAVGIRRNAPLKRAPWWLLCGAILAMATGDALYSVSARQPGLPQVLADVCYLAMFPLGMASFAALTRTSYVLGDRSRLLDLLAVTCAAVLLSWVFLVGPGLDDTNLSTVEKSTIAAYVLGDLLVLITSVRLVIAARRSWSVILLTAGSAGLLAANVAYAYAQTHGGWQAGGPAELGYLVLYLGWGASALHPSMAELTAPVDARPVVLGGRRSALLRLCLAIPPAALFVEAVTGRVRDGVVIAIASIVMCELVILGLTDMIRRHGRAVARERGLREACGALVATVDPDEVRDALRVAVGRLVPAGTDHRVVVSVGSGQPPAAVAPGRRARILRTRQLHPALARELDRFERTLVCPLPLGQRSRADAGTGGPAASWTVFVAAHQRVLNSLPDAVEVLAAQAVLALERITLSDMVNRRDGDLYLRTVIQNTADVVLIIDDDERIRYVSPSLMTVLDVDPSAYATLRDIVHPDDHGQVARTRDLAEDCPGPDGAQGLWNLRRPDGSRVLVEVSYRDLRHDRMVRGFVVTMRDVTERRAREQEVIRLALQNTSGWRNRQSALNRFR